MPMTFLPVRDNKVSRRASMFKGSRGLMPSQVAALFLAAVLLQ